VCQVHWRPSHHRTSPARLAGSAYQPGGMESTATTEPSAHQSRMLRCRRAGRFEGTGEGGTASLGDDSPVDASLVEHLDQSALRLVRRSLPVTFRRATPRSPPAGHQPPWPTWATPRRCRPKETATSQPTPTLSARPRAGSARRAVSGGAGLSTQPCSSPCFWPSPSKPSRHSRSCWQPVPLGTGTPR